MACTQEFIEFLCSQLEGVGEIRCKKMFGDWMVYVDEKPIILACDDTAYVKMLAELSDLMADAEVGCPYDGAREHYILDVSHREHVQKVVSTLLPIIPFPKKRAKKQCSAR